MSNAANLKNQKNSLGVFYTNIGKSVNKGLDSLNKGLNEVAEKTSEVITNAANSLKNTPKNISENLSSLLPFKTDVTVNSNVGKAPNISTTPNVAKDAEGAYNWVVPLLVFIVIAVIFIVIFVKYQDKINAGIHNIIQKIRTAFNRPSSPPTDASNPPQTTVNEIPIPPQEEQNQSLNNVDKVTKIIDKVLPQSNPEVFNVSENNYTYYDAEPLCRALGAELATYDQVKDAWSRGADWCNYGWVKGQAAVYPTQKETYERVQSGPEENRNSCGVVGLNGGYFENPEMKFGVNCYGPKPVQSEHSQEVLMKQETIPLTVPALEEEKKTQEFKAHIDSIGVLPFNNGKWSTE